jgi:hypothetical protein
MDELEDMLQQFKKSESERNEKLDAIKNDNFGYLKKKVQDLINRNKKVAEEYSKYSDSLIEKTPPPTEIPSSNSSVGGSQPGKNFDKSLSPSHDDGGKSPSERGGLLSKFFGRGGSSRRKVSGDKDSGSSSNSSVGGLLRRKVSGDKDSGSSSDSSVGGLLSKFSGGGSSRRKVSGDKDGGSSSEFSGGGLLSKFSGGGLLRRKVSGDKDSGSSSEFSGGGLLSKFSGGGSSRRKVSGDKDSGSSSEFSGGGLSSKFSGGGSSRRKVSGGGGGRSSKRPPRRPTGGIGKYLLGIGAAGAGAYALHDKLGDAADEAGEHINSLRDKIANIIAGHHDEA